MFLDSAKWNDLECFVRVGVQISSIMMEVDLGASIVMKFFRYLLIFFSYSFDIPSLTSPCSFRYKKKILNMEFLNLEQLPKSNQPDRQPKRNNLVIFLFENNS